MEPIKIQDSDFASLKGKVVVITGGSSGIGLATTQLLLSIGALVVAGDLNESPVQNANLSFQKSDVSQWSDLLALFKLAISKHGQIDHVFANAGIGPRADYFASKFDEAGELLEPAPTTLDVNLKAVVNTSYLALHYFRTQGAKATDETADASSRASIVVTGSATSYQPFIAVDYSAAKHGVLGFMRGIVAILAREKVPVRINGIGPDWTITGLVPEAVASAATQHGGEVQSADAVARNVALLFADDARQGEFHYSVGGRYYEIEQSVLLPAARSVAAKSGRKGAEGISTQLENMEASRTS